MVSIETLALYGGAAFLFFILLIVCLNFARHPGRRTKRRGEHEPKRTISDRVGGTMNLILLLLGVIGVAFTVTMIVVYCKTGGIPDTLVTCFFAAVFGECGVMGMIRHAKIKHGTATQEEPAVVEEIGEEEFPTNNL